jgi:hypothetical protein
VRDVTFGEDRSPLRSGDATQILAAVRNLAHTLIRRTGTTAIAAARRAFSYHPARALAPSPTIPPVRSRCCLPFLENSQTMGPTPRPVHRICYNDHEWECTLRS